MNNKLNGWNNNLTPFDGVGGKPGYHEKIQTMTPEQKKAKEIVEKYIKIIFGDLYFEYPHLKLKLQETAKACAIEEVKAVIEENKSVLQMLERHGSERSMLPVRFRIQDLEQVLTEIEKL